MLNSTWTSLFIILLRLSDLFQSIGSSSPIMMKKISWPSGSHSSFYAAVEDALIKQIPVIHLHIDIVTCFPILSSLYTYVLKCIRVNFKFHFVHAVKCVYGPSLSSLLHAYIRMHVY